MIQLISGEWLKLRKRWMPRVLLVILLIIIALLFWGGGTSANNRSNLFIPRGWLAALLYTTFLAQFLWPILAGSWSGNEYGWGTIRLVLSRRPNRVQYVLAAMLTLLVAVVIALLATVLLACLAGAIVAAATGNSIVSGSVFTSHFFAVLLKLFLATLLVNAFYLLLAYAAGTIFRSGAVGIGIGIGLNLALLVVGGIFIHLGGVWQTMAEHFPNTYTGALPQRLAAEGLTRGYVGLDQSMPSIGESVIALLIYTLVPVIVSLFLISRRDVTA